MPYGGVIPPFLYDPARLDDFIRWVCEHLPGPELRNERDYLMKYWYQANDLPYDGEKFAQVLACEELMA